jgi:glycosyltransferase
VAGVGLDDEKVDQDAAAPASIHPGFSRLHLKITVVTAVLDRAPTIAEAIASVRAQTHGMVEHVVQDGGSTDGTQTVLSRLAHPSMRLECKPDGGLYEGINRGIARATGEVIGLMHSDDLFAAPDILDRVADAMADPSLDGVYGDLVYVRAEDPGRVIRVWQPGAFCPERLRLGWMPPHPTLYLRREVFERWGAYDTDFRIAADYEAMLRWLVQGRIRLGYIPRVMVRMRMGGESNRSLGRILCKSAEDYRAMRRHGVGGMGTLLAKNVSKLGQFARKEPAQP